MKNILLWGKKQNRILPILGILEFNWLGKIYYAILAWLYYKGHLACKEGEELALDKFSFHARSVEIPDPPSFFSLLKQNFHKEKK